MRIARQLAQEGFTTVELLITLFIAAMFLFSGYTLYAQVARSGADASTVATVSNKAYELVKSKAATVTARDTGGCINNSETLAPSNTTTTETVTDVGLVTYLITVKCPYGTSPAIDLFLVKVSASYARGGATEQLETAIYAN